MTNHALRRSGVATVRTVVARTHWYHPEWCAVAVSVSGWLCLAAVASAEPALWLGIHGGHTPVEALQHSGVMAAAMMAPLVLDQVKHCATFSLWARRYRSAAGFLVGYLGLWTVVGAAIMLTGGAMADVVGWLPAVLLGFVVATAAAFSQGRRRRLRQCAMTVPLALRGWRADLSCVRFGAATGWRCVLTGWPLMLAVMVEHGLVLMSAATVLMVMERRGRGLSAEAASAGVVGLGLLALVLAVVAGADLQGMAQAGRG